MAWFAEETAAVERAVDALTKRLEKLEATLALSGIRNLQVKISATFPLR